MAASDPYLHHVWLERQRFVIGSESIVRSLERGKGVGAPPPRFGKLRTDRERTIVGSQCFIVPPEMLEHIATNQIVFGKVGLEADRAITVCERIIKSLDLQQRCRTIVVGAGMT